MTMILDSHVLLWLVREHPQLGSQARAACDRALTSDSVAVSAASFFELSNEHRKNRVALEPTPEQWCQNVLRLGIIEFPVDTPVAIVAGGLLNFHNDPLDRIIVASALRHDATLMTADAAILRWEGPLRRIDARR
ncbi:MAG: type II toxin-antitoxin system VapC family toxin [Reyranellaceae bacterium]